MDELITLKEPSVAFLNVLTWGAPFIGFYAGLFFRHYAFAGTVDS